MPLYKITKNTFDLGVYCLLGFKADYNVVERLTRGTSRYVNASSLDHALVVAINQSGKNSIWEGHAGCFSLANAAKELDDLESFRISHYKRSTFAAVKISKKK